jgi:excisionase family DNA binding protein
MENFLTARQVQDILTVDRITVYRMLQDGRLKGVKIGQQWRFPRREFERMLESETPNETAAQPVMDPGFPTHCVQTIQDLYSDVSQIGAVMVDQNGEALTQVSHACTFCQAMLASSSGREACEASWQTFAKNSAGVGKYFTCHAGLQYIGSPVIEKGQRVGLFLTGQFYWQAPDSREEGERIRRLAAAHHLPLEKFQQAAHEILTIDPAQQTLVETWPTAAARAVQSILNERSGFVERLQQIANLTQIS